MSATGYRVGGTFCIVIAMGLAVLAGTMFGETNGGLVGVNLLFFAIVFAFVSLLLFDSAGVCYVSDEGAEAKLNYGQVYETVICKLVDKDRYVALVKDTAGSHWAFYAKKVLPPVFVVRHGEERYVPFGIDFGKAALPAESPTS